MGKSNTKVRRSYTIADKERILQSIASSRLNLLYELHTTVHL